MMPPSSRRCAAFVLIELMVVLILLAAFAIIFEQGITLALETQNRAQRREESMQRTQSALEALRHDTWTATRLTTPSDRRLEIRGMGSAGPQTITWESTEEGGLTRRVEGPQDVPLRTYGGTPDVRFAVKGALVEVTVTPRSDEKPDRIESQRATLVSQPLLAGGAR